MLPLPYTKLIHERLSTVLTFAYSWAKLQQLLKERFPGEWKNLRKTIDTVSPENAIRAFIELAAYLRLLDDAEDWARDPLLENRTFGRLLKQDGSETPLYLRDVTNKIMHAREWRWDVVSDPDRPKLVCVSDEPERWVGAEVDIETLAYFCGLLTH
jgi:hypothetical protein